MAEEKLSFNEKSLKISSVKYQLTITVAILLIIALSLSLSLYTIDANENGIILRLGKLHRVVSPGLNMKIPWGIDKLYRVKIDYQYKEEFGFRTVKPSIDSTDSKEQFDDESWMLTGDLNITDVQWIVQYKIKDPVTYLFNLRDVNESIRDISEATMRLIVGDRSFHEVLQSDRKIIADLSKQYMQETLDKYHAGISVQLIQLKDVNLPEPVRDSFNEANRAKQEQEIAISEAKQQYDKEISQVQGEADKMIEETKGYSINKINQAEGDARFYTSLLEEYLKSKELTKSRLYIETIEDIMKKVDKKYIFDKNLKGIMPLINLQGKEAGK